jgi:hypothetical protein
LTLLLLLLLLLLVFASSCRVDAAALRDAQLLLQALGVGLQELQAAAAR